MLNESEQKPTKSSLIVMEKEEQKWDQELQVEEKEEDSLKLRRSRDPNGGNPFQSSAAAVAEEDSTELNKSNGSSKTNGHLVHPSKSVIDNVVVDESVVDKSEEKEVPADPENFVAPSDNGVHKETKLKEGHPKSNNCVYYDKNEEHIEENHRSDALGIMTADVGAEKDLNSVIALQSESIQKNVKLSTPQHSEIVPEECTSYNSSKITEIEPPDVDIVDESDTEGAEVDVERVLQKQNTHDLYCPNCNSCITRRVILRKRKRQVRITGEDVKRNKLEVITDSTAKGSYQQATGNQDHGTGYIHPEVISERAVNDHEHERGPDIFRCLSCFSIFIPTGKGFKLFDIFGNKGKKKTLEDQQISSANLSDKDRITAVSGSNVKGDFQKDSPKEHLPSSSQLNDPNCTPENQGDRDKASTSSAQQQLMHEKVMPGVGNILYDTKPMKTGDDAKNNFAVAPGNQPKASNVSKDSSYLQGDQSGAVPANRIPASVGESKMDSVPVSKPDGLKILVSANMGSTTLGKLPMDQTPDLKVQSLGSDMESVPSMPLKASNDKKVDANGNMTNPVEIFHEQHIVARVPAMSAYGNGTKDKLSNYGGASSYELPHHTIDENKEQIHAEEQLKSNKDGLVLSVKEPSMIQDKLVDSVKDVKKVTISSTGKETVIVVEAAGPSKTAVSQLLQDSSSSAHLGTDINVVERMRADAGEAYEIEIIKSIVYGGLIESITSLGVVSSAAGGGTATLNILALAVANLIGGLVLVGHNLWDLKKYQVAADQTDRYKELLGRRENFVVHATVAVLSFIIFGLICPTTYCFSFQKSDDRDLKILAASAASLVCIVLLATGREYVRKQKQEEQQPKSYIKTVSYYVLMGFSVSGISYGAGELLKRVLDKFHGLHPPPNQSVSFFTQKLPHASLWGSY